MRLAAAQGSAALALYVALCAAESMARPEQKEWFPISLQSLAELSGLARRSVMRTLPILEKLGLISVKSGANSAGKMARNLYQIAESRECHGGPSSRAMVALSWGHGGPTRECHGGPTIKEKQIEGGGPPSHPPLHKKEIGQAKPRPPLDGGTSLPQKKISPALLLAMEEMGLG